MIEQVVSKSRLRREGQRFFLNNSEVFGVQSANIQYQTNLVPLKHLSIGCVQATWQGPQLGKASVSRLVIDTEPFINYTGTLGFNGYIIQNKKDTFKNFSFTSGYLSSYNSNCAIGEIPQTSVNIDIFGNVGQISYSESPETSKDFDYIETGNSLINLKITQPGSIELDLDDFNTNRILSYSLNINCPRNPIYFLGSRFPNAVETNWPLEVNVIFQFDIDDYTPKTLRDFPCNPKVKNLSLSLNTFDTHETVQSFNFNDLFLVSESYNNSVDSNVGLTAQYRTFLTRS